MPSLITMIGVVGVAGCILAGQVIYALRGVVEAIEALTEEVRKLRITKP